MYYHSKYLPKTTRQNSGNISTANKVWGWFLVVIIQLLGYFYHVMVISLY
jgi:hypothetical protein